jgi:hypothetical protein
VKSRGPFKIMRRFPRLCSSRANEAQTPRNSEPPHVGRYGFERASDVDDFKAVRFAAALLFQPPTEHGRFKTVPRLKL